MTEADGRLVPDLGRAGAEAEKPTPGFRGASRCCDGRDGAAGRMPAAEAAKGEA
ncbi:MAG TPA: hypothetical protein VF668_06815 [Pyrinomonadaceae bacterium]|jgi:hypothetical protein